MRVTGTKPMNPGLLRHEITWQEKRSPANRNTFGEHEVEWMEVVTMRARVQELMGRELDTARQKWAEARYKITQHWVSTMKRAQRGAWPQYDGSVRYLDILDVQNEGGLGMVQVIYAKEWTA